MIELSPGKVELSTRMGTLMISFTVSNGARASARSIATTITPPSKTVAVEDGIQ